MDRLSARDNHIIMPGFGVPRHNTGHCRAQSALGAVSRYRTADPPARRIAAPDRCVAIRRISSCSCLARRCNGLQDQPRHRRFAALGRGMEKLGPPRQADDPGDHRPIPRGVCALWRGAAKECGGRRRISYGSEIRADACARYCWAETFASMACLRQISSAGPKLRCGRMCLLWKSPLYTDLKGQSQCWQPNLPQFCPITGNWRGNHIRASLLTFG